MSRQPSYTRHHRRTDALVEFVDTVDDAEPMDWSRGLFLPRTIKLTYRHAIHAALAVRDGDTDTWRAGALVSGRRIRKNGSLGADDASVWVGWNEPGTPAWVNEHIARNHPPTEGVVELERWTSEQEPAA